jgi:molybdate transport repressor ModE-like protein
MDWSERIGRRVKLRDLHMLLAVGQFGSMTRAAERLAISHSVVSKTISELEEVLHARLLDRTPRGTELTECGRALVKSATAVFDELRRGIQDVELICDPTRGEVRIGANTAMMDGFLPAAIARVTHRYPQIKVHAFEGDGPTLYSLLRERKVDFVIARRLVPSFHRR